MNKEFFEHPDSKADPESSSPVDHTTEKQQKKETHPLRSEGVSSPSEFPVSHNNGLNSEQLNNGKAQAAEKPFAGGASWSGQGNNAEEAAIPEPDSSPEGSSPWDKTGTSSQATGADGKPSFPDSKILNEDSRDNSGKAGTNSVEYNSMPATKQQASPAGNRLDGADPLTGGVHQTPSGDGAFGGQGSQAGHHRLDGADLVTGGVHQTASGGGAFGGQGSQADHRLDGAGSLTGGVHQTPSGDGTFGGQTSQAGSHPEGADSLAGGIYQTPSGGGAFGGQGSQADHRLDGADPLVGGVHQTPSGDGAFGGQGSQAGDRLDGADPLTGGVHQTASGDGAFGGQGSQAGHHRLDGADLVTGGVHQAPSGDGAFGGQGSQAGHHRLDGADLVTGGVHQTPSGDGAFGGQGSQAGHHRLDGADLVTGGVHQTPSGDGAFGGQGSQADHHRLDGADPLVGGVPQTPSGDGAFGGQGSQAGDRLDGADPLVGGVHQTPSGDGAFGGQGSQAGNYSDGADPLVGGVSQTSSGDGAFGGQGSQADHRLDGADSLAGGVSHTSSGDGAFGGQGSQADHRLDGADPLTGGVHQTPSGDGAFGGNGNPADSYPAGSPAFYSPSGGAMPEGEQAPYSADGNPFSASPMQGGGPPYAQWPGYRQGMEDPSLGGRPPKKKMDKGLKIFLWAVGIVLGGFVLAFSGYGIFSVVSGLPTGGDSSSSPSSSPSSDVSSSPQMNNNVPSGPVTDPNWGGLELENQQTLDGGTDTLSAAEIYAKQAPAIVGICVYNQGSQPGDDPAMEGSGIIISENGYIMTNSHVINDSNEFPVEVVLSNGDRYAAAVVGYDKRTDLAVVKVEAAGLPVAVLGKSDELRVGDWVLAIGNPGGLNYSNSLTRGIVSAINRSVESKAQTAMKYIQTDTAINPGNSGGALLNMYGQVIGINTAKIQGYEGMGFAIPITTAKKIVDDIIENGYVAGRVRLGLTGSIVSEYHARMYNLPQGVIIRSLTDDSDLVAKGVMEDDIITKINAKDVISMDDIYDELASCAPGDTVKLTIFRSGTGMTKPTTFEVEVTLLEDKGETQ